MIAKLTTSILPRSRVHLRPRRRCWPTTITSTTSLSFSSTSPSTPAETEKMISDLQRELRDMYSAQNYDEAIDLVRDLERITTEFYGENHPVTVSSINNHALLKRATGEYASAVELFTTAIQKYEKSVGKDHTSTATALHNLGLTYKSMYESGDHTSMEQIQLQDRAEEALRESMSRRAEDHVDRATTMYVLASVRSTQVREFTRSRKFCCAGCICKFLVFLLSSLLCFCLILLLLLLLLLRKQNRENQKSPLNCLKMLLLYYERHTAHRRKVKSVACVLQQV